MPELAYNILWSWEPIIRGAVPEAGTRILWRECNYNPGADAGARSRATLQRAASDPRYVALYGIARAAATTRTSKEASRAPTAS